MPPQGFTSSRRFVPIALFVAACLALPVAVVHAAPPAFVSPQPVEKTLENGLHVVVFEDPRLPIAQIQLFVTAGMAAEAEDQPGIAHLTAQMLKRGTADRDAERFKGDMAQLGAEFTISSLRDYTVMGAGFLNSDLESGLTLVASAVMNPLFSNEEIGRARFEITRALIDVHLNPVATAEEQVWLLALDGHPYGQPPAGTVSGILQRTREELEAFHERYYRPGGSVLAVAGDVKAEAVFEMARLAFSGWEGSAASTPSLMVGPGSRRPRIRIIDLPTGGRTELRLASAAPERGSVSFLPFTVANGVFSEIAGSRLARRGAWPGSAVNVAATYAALRDAGLFTVRATARTDSAGVTLEALRQAITDYVANPPAAEEIHAAKNLQLVTWPMGLSTLAGLLGTWGDADYYGLEREAMRGFTEGLDTLDAAGVGRVIRQWIDPSRLSIIAVGPADQLRPQLAPFGEVEVVQLDDSAQAPWATNEPTDADRKRGREIVERGVKAHGGRAPLRSMKDSSIDASVIINAQGREVTGRLRQARKEPFKFREIMTVFVYENEQVLVGDHGWVYETQQDRVEQATSDQVATMRSNFLSDLPHLLRQAMEDSAETIHRGEDDVRGRRANVVEVRLQSEEKQLWLLFDSETHELVASDIRGGIPPRILARRIFSDFRKVQDLRLPFEEERFVQNVQLMKIQVKEIGYNIGIADALFKAPEIRN
jgi:zinc protease